jgi:hypothetical protein
MTELLEKAVAEMKQLPEAEQDAIAALILSELESEERWNQAFFRSPDALSALAQEALAEFRAGKTVPLDVETL